MRNIFKTALSTAFLATSLSNTSLAKTQGHYVGISAINTEANITATEAMFYQPEYSKTEERKKYRKQNALSYGLEYKYAFNYKGIFIAPKILYDRNNIKDSYINPNLFTPGITYSADTKSYNNTTTLKHSYGFGFDIGYDINSKFSIYTTLQHKKNNLKFSSVLDHNSRIYEWHYKVNYKSLVYGFGAKYQIEPNFDIFASYEFINNTSGYDNPYSDHYRPSVYNVARVGISYNFFSDKQSFLRSVLTKKDNTSQVSTSHNNKSFFSKSYDYLKDKKSTTSSFFAKGYNDIKNLITNKKSKNTTLNNQTLNNTELENITTNKKQYKLNNKKKYRQQTIKKRYVKKP